MSKNVLILGASSDIGKKVVKYFLNSGHTVFLHYNSMKPKIKSKNVKYLKCNFIKNENFQNFINKIKKVNFLSFVNLIGYIDNKELSRTDCDDLIKSLKINFIFSVLITNFISDKMIKQNMEEYYIVLQLVLNLVEVSILIPTLLQTLFRVYSTTL